MRDNKQPSTVSEPSETTNANVSQTLLDFGSIVAASPDGIVSTCLDTSVRTWNRGAEMLFGYSREEAIGKKLDSLIIAADDDKGRGALGSIFSRSHQPARKAFQCQTKSGGCVVVEANSANLYGAANEIVGSSLVIRDISHKAHAEQELRKREQQFRAVFDQTAALIAIVGLDGILIDCNDSACDQTGWQRSAQVEKLFWETDWWGGSPETKKVLRQDFERASVGEKVVRDTHYLTAKGERFAKRTMAPARDRDGKIFSVIAEVHDTTDQRLVQQHLEQFASLADHSTDFIGIATTDGRLRYINKAGRSMIGFSVTEDPSSLHMSDYVAPKSLPMFLKEVVPQLQSTGLWEGEMQLINMETKSTVDVHRSTFALRDIAGQPTAYASVTRNMSQVKLGEFLLRASESFNRELVESNPDCLKVLDLEGRLQFINFNGQMVCDIDDFGSFAGKYWSDLWPMESAPIILAAIAAANAGKVSRFEAFCPTAKGKDKWWDVVVTPVSGGDGQVVSILAVSRDITDKKRIEQTLRDQAALIELSPDAIIVRSLGGKIYAWNKGAEQIYGFTRSEAEGKFSQDLLQSRFPIAPAQLQQELDVTRHWQGEVVQKRRDGAEVIVLCRWQVQYADDGQPLRILETNTDITQRKRFDQALRDSQLRLRHAADSARLTYFELDVARSLVRTADNFSSVMGFALSGGSEGTEALTAQADYYRHVHPDDKARVARAVQDIPVDDGHRKVEHRVLGDDGVERWVETAWSVEKSKEGVLLRGFAPNLDITDRKRAEEHIFFLMREVNHRAKNVLAVVEAIARQTATSGDPAIFVKRLSDRIHGLSTSQDLLVKTDWQGVEMAALVQGQLALFQDLIGNRVTLSGVPALLSPAAAQALGMALHELATNAGKYGALSDRHGKVLISWQIESGDEPIFEICWTETGGPPVSKPDHPGFGEVVIKRMAETALNGKAFIEYRPGGVYWCLRCPLANVLNANSNSQVRCLG